MAQQQLDSRAVWQFALGSFFGWLIAIIVISFQGFFLFEELGLGGFSTLWIPFVVVVPFLIAWGYGVLSHKFYFYELTDDGFRKESGIIWKTYTTIPYDRIQNVDINRGVIARILGLSDLKIQTAGSSGASYGAWGMVGTGAEGSVPGLAKEVAEQLRDDLIRRAKTARTQGL